ncbi:MAG: AAA family ATPase [Anaerolineales bacterium]|nr:AAA family ATPase [Anaerolineales bacterium]
MIGEFSDSERPSASPVSLPDAAPAAESPLLHTKLRIPGAPPALLTRPRLNSQLHQRPNGRLTLLSAPAGFGKTTVVMDWARRQDSPVAWLTLDEQDNDPALFWRYLIAALQVVDGRIGQSAHATLSAIAWAPLETAVTLLINDIVSYTDPAGTLILVLDDFHWIQTAAIHQSLNYLLQHQPPQLHLLLLTRADPPLSLARLRVTGRLVELRAADLRLTAAEIAAFFTQVVPLHLSDADLQLLGRQTEGWAAGLQLAALSLRQRDAADVARLVQSFAGIRQHIFAYLMEEVLQHQPEAVRRFLQQTAVLRRFCGPLCIAVTEQPDAARVLRHLAANNLFITPLDDEGTWYRYHPLFAEMLRSHLDEAAQRACHRRAAVWYAGQQMLQDAMRNAQAAQDYALMADLLTRHYKALLAQALLVSLQKWLAVLPAEYRSPRLRLAAAWCRVYEGNEPHLQQTLAHITAHVPRVDPPLQGEILAVKAIYASLYGQPDEAIRWAAEAISLIAEDDHLSLAAAHQALGNAYRYQGELDAALGAYAQARQQFDAMGNPFMGHLPLYRMASIQIMQGRLHQAWQTYEAVRQHAQAAGQEPLILTGEVFGYLSDLHLEWNELPQAAACARQEIDLAKAGHTLLALADGYLKLAAVLAAQGNAPAARDALRLARDTAVELRSPSVTAQVAVQQARLELAWDNLPAAAAWAAAYAGRRGTPACTLTPLLAQAADLLLARIWLAQDQAGAALDLLQETMRAVEASGRIRLVVEAQVLQALAWMRQEQAPAAHKALRSALHLAKPEGYVRLFIENGPALAPLLVQARPHFPEYVSRLLAAMPGPAAAAVGLLDPLTEREQDILNLIAKGHANRQIAEALFISVGTVKGHVNHIFSKLDVRSRTQALVRARELNLLP